MLNGCSELVSELFGPDAGKHAWTAMGITSMPFDLPMVIAAEVEISG